MKSQSSRIFLGLLAGFSLSMAVPVHADPTSGKADGRQPVLAAQGEHVSRTVERNPEVIRGPGSRSSTDCNNNGHPDGFDIATGISDDCNGNGIPDECDVAVRSVYDFPVNPPDPILDGITINRTFNIPEGGTVVDVDLGVTLTHEFLGDLIISLTHGETSVDVYYYGPCGDCPGTCGFGGTVFDDEASGLLPCIGLNQGIFLPVDALSAFDGMDAAGEWTLEVFDGFIGFEGSLAAWSLSVETSRPGDCNVNGIPDECDLADGSSDDCNGNNMPDECDFAAGTTDDCNDNGVPDECDVAAASSYDCNANNIPDECDIADSSADCNGNGRPDECDIAAPIDQWASTVLDFSSQYRTDVWSAEQALGPPDTFNYGDIPTAWAPAPSDGTLEFITVGFEQPVFANGVTVRETYANGFVFRIDVVDTLGGIHTVWEGNDPSLPGSPVDFRVDWPRTEFLVIAVTVHVDTDTHLLIFEEVDAIQLHGAPGNSSDCNANAVPDECEIAAGSADCNANGIPDDCDIAPLGTMIDQWALYVIAFSSEIAYLDLGPAVLAVGAPDATVYGGFGASWVPGAENGTLEFITVGYLTPVYATGVTIREAGGNGMVYQVDVLDMNDDLHTVWQGTDPSLPGSIVDYEVTWPITSYLVKGVKVYVDTGPDQSGFEFIDAIALHGRAASDCNDNYTDDWCEFGLTDCNANGIPDGCDVLPREHNCCELGQGPGCNDPFIEACVCKMLPECCSVSWNDTCVDAVETYNCGSCEGGSDDCNANDIPDDCEFGPLGAPTGQWASSLIEFSSEFESGDFRALQAVGPPDTPHYSGPFAWTPQNQDGTLEFIALRYSTPIYATGVTISETLGNGMVYKVDVLDTNDVLHTVWEGVDPSLPGTMVDFEVTWPITSYLVTGVKVHIATDHSPLQYESLDAIALHSRAGSDCNDNGVNDWCEFGLDDCNANGIPDGCDVLQPVHDCCESGGGAGCSDPIIEACVCNVLPGCCSKYWDDTCALAVETYSCGSCEPGSADCNANGILDDCELGDFNDDGTVSLLDYKTLHKCYTAPDVLLGPGCAAGDFDCDNDIDLRDFAVFQVKLSVR